MNAGSRRPRRRRARLRRPRSARRAEEAQRQETRAELQRLIAEAVPVISSIADADVDTYCIRYKA